MTVLQGEAKARYVANMFARIVPRYDLMNRLMTFTMDRRWRAETVDLAALPPGGRALDVATGTGDLALEFLRRSHPGLVVATDFCEPMLHVARRKLAEHEDRVVTFQLGDALHLPYRDDSFDAVTIGFALRNVADLPSALRELWRVTRPGGRLVSLELTRPRNAVVAALFAIYFYRLVPAIGGLVTGEPDAYTYLPNSLTHFPRAGELAQMLLEAGFVRVDVHLRAMGTIALHVATK